jgi:ADP-ribosylglycohydrolase/catechol 2,3-dioxygenase-like lactoylglutathione lyase family enzyme
MSTDALVTGRDRPAGTLLGAAVGDALGWPQENRSRIVGGNTARNVEPAPRFRDWVRSGGTRFAAYQDPVGAGEYSDDTQLMMAVARACLRGPDWWSWLATVELPLWPLYQRGGGGAVLRAARAWSKGRPPWAIETAKDTAAAGRYFDAGGNGVAMRIAPHAIVAAYGGNPEEMTRRIVADGLTTHGHPHALIGAVIHGHALFQALSKVGTLEYGELLDRLIDQPAWADPSLLMDVAEVGWFDSYRAVQKAKQPLPHPARAWDDTAREVLTSLTQVRQALGRGTLVNDHDTLEAIGCFDDRRSGAGTVAAVAAAYVTSRSAARPVGGLLRTAFLHDADTDTIASMTGSLLGALHGTQWLGPLGRDVQDGKYILELSEQLARPHPQLRTEPSSPAEPIHVTESALRRFNNSLLNDDAEVDRLPDERPFHIQSRVPLESKSRSYVTRVIGRAEDGQTLLIDRVARNRPEPDERGRPTAQGHLFHADNDPQASLDSASRTSASPDPKTRITRMELRVADLEASARFYGGLLGLTLQRHSGQIILDNGLLLTQARTATPGASGVRGFILTITHLEPEQLADDAEALQAQAVWSDDHSSLWLKDPDGNSVRVPGASQ